MGNQTAPNLTIPEGITLPQQSILSKFLGAVGTGIGTGTATALQKRLLGATDKQKQLTKARGEIGSRVKKGLADLGLKDVETEELLRLQGMAENKLSETGDPLSIDKMIQDYVRQKVSQLDAEQEAESAKPSLSNPEKRLTKDLAKFAPFFKQGLTRESTAAALLGKHLTPEEIAQRSIEDPSFAQQMVQDTGVLAGDLPFMAIGAKLGGAKLALALPAFLKAASREIYDGLRSDEKFTLRKGGEAALRVAADTSKAAMMGAILEKIPGATKFIEKIPGAKKYLDNYVAQQLLNRGLEVGALATVPAALEGRLPTQRDFTSALGLVLTFEAARLPASIRKNIETRAAKTGMEPEAFAKRVATEAREKNIDVKKLESGEGREIQKLNRVVNKIARDSTKEVKKTARVAEEAPKPKIRKEALETAAKERQAISKRISESPLDAYYAPKKEVTHRPETIVKEKARLSTLKETSDSVHRELKRVNKNIVNRQNQARKSFGKSKEGIESRLESLKSERDFLHNKVRDIEFEKKYKRKPPTESEIKAQIEKSFKNLKEVIETSDLEKFKKFETQFAKDKKYISQSEKILKLGDLPSEGQRGTFIKIKEMYSNAYKDLLKENRKFIKENRNKKAKNVIKAVQETKQMNKLISKRLKRAEADIVRQKDKRGIQRLLRGPQGSFYRNQLKNLRKDVEAFQKDVFKRRRLRGEVEFKTEVSSRKAFNEIRSLTKSYVERPTEGKIGEIANKVGIEKEPLKDFVSNFGKRFEAVVKRAKEGKATIAETTKITKDVNKWLQKYKKLPKLHKALISGVAVWMVQNIVEKTTGAKPTAREISLFSPGGVLVKIGSGTVGSRINKLVKGGVDKIEANKFKKIIARRNLVEIARHKRALKTKFSTQRASQIEKLARGQI